MTPRRLGLMCGALAALGFFAVSSALHVRPGHPMAKRTDVFFQSDAGGLIQDAVLNRNGRARGTHPLVYPLGTRPLHSLCIALAPSVPPDTTAVLASRLLVALAAGVGVGALAGALRANGLSVDRAFAFAALAVVANGHALAAIPDHFGFSVGGIGIAFATVLSNCSDRAKLAILAALAPVLFGITITNVLLPVGLIGLLVVVRNWHRRRWWHLAGVAGLALTAFVGYRMAMASPSIQERTQERITLYLNRRVVDDPVAALGYTVRGLCDSVVAPTPTVSRNNLDRAPMLTYESESGPRPFWPHDGLQTVGALVWLSLLVWGTAIAVRKPTHRLAAVGAIGWVLGNAAFHNYWGDEYFLYTPHYALPLALLAALGYSSIPSKAFYPPLLVVGIAALHTLRIYSERLNVIFE